MSSYEKKYELYTISKLKEELRKRKAKVSGKKEELIKRLVFFDVNTVNVEPDPEYNMDIPDFQNFKDLHAGMKDSVPTMTRLRLDDYLNQHDKAFEDKYKQLYEERFLRSLRIAKKNQGDLSVLYLTSVMWAEMKKSVTYRVDIAVSADGVIMEAQCECGAGQGPTAHCKHVCTVYYAAVEFSKSGSVITELTCTQTLQKFHHAKPFKGSPMEATNLQAIRGRDSVLSYDPRPQHFRNLPNVQDNLRNTCLNFQSNQPMPVLQLFPPANPHAVFMDHDYLKLNDVDQFLHDEKVSVITRDESNEIEENTRGQNKCKKWRTERLKHITASRYGEICKATARKDLKSFATSMTTYSTLRTPQTLHGQKYEAVAVEKYEKLCGKVTNECGLFISVSNPVLAASPDRIVDKDTLVEVKCPFVSRNKEITHITVPYLKVNSNNNLELDTNHNYYYQVQGQLYCSDRKYADFIVYTFKDLKVIRVDRDPLFISDMIQKLLAFYESHFKDAMLDHFLYRSYYKYNFD